MQLNTGKYRRLALGNAALLGLASALVLAGPAPSGPEAAHAQAPKAKTATSTGTVRTLTRRLSGRSGAYILDVETGRRIASRRGNSKRIIASNTKLYTAAAALDRFGTGGRFSTGIWTTASVVEGRVGGNIYLRGGGDPLFGSARFVKKNFGSRATVEQLARNLHAAGIRRVDGHIVADESVFDDRRGTAKYRFRASSEIGGQLSGLAYNKGFASGRFASDPARYAAQQLRSALRKKGIRVASRTSTATTPPGATRLAYVDSLPLSALVRQMNKASNNYLAEMLIKALALPQSAAAQTGAVVPLGSRAATTRLGVRVARIFAAKQGSRGSLSDGSGLSRRDRVAPKQVATMLRSMTLSSQFAEFERALPIAGIDGTLAKRMRGTPARRRCKAKTGTLSNVSSLSGYCNTVGGRRVAFAILQNRVTPYFARAQQDRLVAAIARLR